MIVAQYTIICVHLQAKKGEIRPPKLKTEDPNKSYVQRPVKRGWIAWFWPGRVAVSTINQAFED